MLNRLTDIEQSELRAFYVRDEINGRIEKLTIIRNFLDNNLNLSDWLNKHYPNTLCNHIDTIVKWISYPKVVWAFCDNTDKWGEAYMDLESAIRAKKSANQHIIIHIPAIGMYGIYTPSNFRTFLTEFRKIAKRHKCMQILLADQPQKYMFKYNGNQLEDLVDYTKHYFDNDISELRVASSDTGVWEITIAELTTSSLEQINQYNEAWKRIMKQYNDSVYPPTQHKIAGHIYTTRDISDIMKSPLSNINQILGNTCLLDIPNIQDMVIKSPAKEQKIRAQQWIKSNPPIHGEKTTDYYNRYRSNYGTGAVPNNVFGEVMKGLKYNNKKTDTCRIWIVNK
jgi:hypothetical protein